MSYLELEWSETTDYIVPEPWMLLETGFDLTYAVFFWGGN